MPFESVCVMDRVKAVKLLFHLSVSAHLELLRGPQFPVALGVVCGLDKPGRAAWNREVTLCRAAVARPCVMYITC